jgi:hypothetical protein
MAPARDQSVATSSGRDRTASGPAHPVGRNSRQRPATTRTATSPSTPTRVPATATAPTTATRSTTMAASIQPPVVRLAPPGCCTKPSRFSVVASGMPPA